MQGRGAVLLLLPSLSSERRGKAARARRGWGSGRGLCVSCSLSLCVRVWQEGARGGCPRPFLVLFRGSEVGRRLKRREHSRISAGPSRGPSATAAPLQPRRDPICRHLYLSGHIQMVAADAAGRATAHSALGSRCEGLRLLQPGPVEVSARTDETTGRPTPHPSPPTHGTHSTRWEERRGSLCACPSRPTAEARTHTHTLLGKNALHAFAFRLARRVFPPGPPGIRPHARGQNILGTHSTAGENGGGWRDCT